MGRLFWKFFAFIWLAQLVGALAVAMGFWFSGARIPTGPMDIDAGPVAGIHVSAASGILEFSGIEAFKEWSRRPRREIVLAIGDNDRDLLERPVAAPLIARARDMHASRPESPQVAEVLTPDHQHFLLFAEAHVPNGRGVPSAGGAPPASDMPVGPPSGMGAPGPGMGPGIGPSMGPGMGGMGPPSGGGWFNSWWNRRIPGFPPLGATLVTFVASLCTAALLAWYVAKPIRSLRSAFASAAAGDLAMRVAPLIGSRHDELADLGKDFDRMAERLQAAMEAQRRLLHDVSHEVRSPLARLQAAVGLMRRKSAGPEPAVERIEEEIVRIDRLVGDLLRLSRLEGGETNESEREIDLQELVADIVTDANFEAQASGRQVLWEPGADAIILGRPDMLRVAIENVVRNALKHAPDSDAIRVETMLDAPHKRFVLRVLDSGPGVPQAELKTLFTPFFRSAQAAHVEGYGLGLAIARRSVEAHRGEIRASNRPEGGLMVEILLPLSG